MSGSLSAAGGDLDLLEAIRGRGYRSKSQAQMLREQSMSPVEIGSYNGIQGNFPVSQGFNKIAQGLLAGYMENQDREKAQAASDAQKAEGLAFAKALQGQEAVATQPAVDAQMGTAPIPGDVAAESPDAARTRMALSRALMTTQGPDGQMPQGQGQGPLPAPMQGQRMEALPGQGAADDPGIIGQAAVAGQAAVPLTQAKRTEMLLQGQLSGNPLMTKVAQHAADQDAIAQQKQDVIASREHIAGENAKARAAASADAAAARATQLQIARDDRLQATYVKAADLTIPKSITVNSAFNAAGVATDETLSQLKALRDSPELTSQVGGLKGWLPTITEPGNKFAAQLKQIQATGGFSALKDLKASGASLGGVSNAEGLRLENSYAALSTKMSPADFKAALNDVIDRTEKFRANLTDAHGKNMDEFGRVINRAYPGFIPSRAAPGGAPPAPGLPQKVDATGYAALPSGAKFIDPNGQLRTKP